MNTFKVSGFFFTKNMKKRSDFYFLSFKESSKNQEEKTYWNIAVKENYFSQFLDGGEAPGFYELTGVLKKQIYQGKEYTTLFVNEIKKIKLKKVPVTESKEESTLDFIDDLSF